MANYKRLDQQIFVDFPNWKSWTYNVLYSQYVKFLEDNNSAGILLTSRLEYYTSWTCVTPCGWGIVASRKKYPEEAKSFFTKVGKYLTRLLGDEAYNVYKDLEVAKCVTKKDVLIWTVIMNRKDYATNLLREGRNSIYAALFASAIFKALSKRADDEENIELGMSFKENSRHFELLACNAIAQMHLEDRSMSQKLLIQPVDEYGFSMKTVMKFSANNQLMQFMGTTACQMKLNSVWRENLAKFTSREMIILSILVPFLIPCIKFMAHTKEGNGHNSSPFSKINLFGLTHRNDAQISLPYAMYCFYNAPVTKFWTNLISYFVMLCCFSYFVLTDLHHLSDGNISLIETLIIFWTSTMLLEETRQILQREQVSLWYKIRSWWRDAWNKFDATMYSLFILSVILRFLLPREHFQWARMTYSITLAIFVLRTLHYFYVVKNTGPKIIMIGKMVTDLQFFIMICVVVLVSFGIIMQANLYPNSEPEWRLLKNVVYMPYWQMYGELFLETIEGQKTSSCTTDPLMYRANTLPRCPESNALIPYVLALYMVLTNIMLINLLIAMFSDTFKKVQTNSVLIWKFYRYSLVYEYYDRPVFIPPLIILNHLYRIVQFLINKLFCKNFFSTNNSFEYRIHEGNIATQIAGYERKAMDACLKLFPVNYDATETRSRSHCVLSDIVMDEDHTFNEIVELSKRVNRKLVEFQEQRMALNQDSKRYYEYFSPSFTDPNKEEDV